MFSIGPVSPSKLALLSVKKQLLYKFHPVPFLLLCHIPWPRQTYLVLRVCYDYVSQLTWHTPYICFLGGTYVAPFLCLAKCTHNIIYIIIIFNALPSSTYQYN